MRISTSCFVQGSLLLLLLLQVGHAQAYVSAREDFVKTIQASIKMDKGVNTGSRLCNPGTYVFGFAQKLHGNQGNGDDTALNDIELYCSNSHQLDRFSLPGGTEFGTWGPVIGCRDGYAVGFKQKVDLTHDSDDTGVTSLLLQCDNGDSILPVNDGEWGTWSSLRLCPIGTAVCGVEAYIQPPQGDNDDTSINDINLMCCKF